MKKIDFLFMLIYIISCSCSPNSQNQMSFVSYLTPGRHHESVQIPTPVPGAAHVIGKLDSFGGFDLFLAEKIGRTERDMIYGMDINNAKKAVIYDNGLFLFMNVKPGRYAIVVWNPAFSYLVKEIEVYDNQIIDVGQITIQN